jgi:hypothetical protein
MRISDGSVAASLDEFDLLKVRAEIRGHLAMGIAILFHPVGVWGQTQVKTRVPGASVESKIKGKLIDARCHSKPKCRVAAETKDYGVALADGTFLVFDEGGNEKVRKFLEEFPWGGKLLQAKPGKAKRITVVASGRRTGNTYNLESIRMAR